MAAADFVAELRELGCSVDTASPAALDGMVVARFPYTIPVGSRRGEKITLGFVVAKDYPLTCPSGPFMTPFVLPLNTASEPPYGGVHAADSIQPNAGFGPDWQYWSRPFQGWADTDRTARAYMRHIKRLFDLI